MTVKEEDIVFVTNSLYTKWMDYQSRIIKKLFPKSDITNVSSYGIDIEDELTKVLSEELAKNIDKEILKNVLGDDYYRNKRRGKSIKKIFKQ